jgi:16S rRNA (cytidine1402-2'-O)-methyltransferase
MLVEKNCLYIVATPIGNPEDITLRALKVLSEVNAVICEEIRQGSKLLKQIGISGKELIPLNEHNEKDQTHLILARLSNHESLALISDCGTPLFSDPGSYLTKQVVSAGFPVVPIPGASSLMAALSVLDIKLTSFVFGGFIAQKTELRIPQLRHLQSFLLPVILMDTPYRMCKLLEEVNLIFGSSQRVTLACDLTLPAEKIFRGSVASVQEKIGKRKAEFILIIHEPSQKSSPHR